VSPTTRRFFQRVLRQWGHGGGVLDVGAFDANGNIRDLFERTPGADGAINQRYAYLGLDMRPGPNVDIIANAHALPFPDETFDLVCCCATLEHDDMPWLSAVEMARVLREGGMLALSVPGFGFPRHEHPDDFWRFSTTAVAQLFPNRDFQIEDLEESAEDGFPRVFYVGRKQHREGR